ncbi:hypothetical protein LINGRAHAP2_LOCUS18453 [Linum grandiflorum]
MIFEGDSQVLQLALANPTSDDTEFGDTVRMIAGLQRCWDSYDYVFVRRERNQVAHALARKSVFRTSPTIGLVPPPGLVDGVTIMCYDTHLH